MSHVSKIRRRLLPITFIVLLAFAMLTGPSGLAAPGAAGDLDTGFGNGGKVEYWPKDLVPVNVVGLAMQGDGKAILAANANESIALARYNPDGSLDPGFGGDGIVIISQELAGGAVGSMALQADGKIVLAIGQTGYKDRAFIVLRLHSNGSIDASFGDMGKVSAGFVGYDAVTRQVAVSGDKLIVAGSLTSTVPGWQIGVVRLLDDGTLDSSFSGDGKQLLDLGSDSPISPDALAIDAVGRVVINGAVASGSRDSYTVVTRFTPAGDLDPTFGVGGKAEVRFVEGGSQFFAIAIDDLGRLALVGSVYVNKGQVSDRDFAVARLLDTGAFDPSFGAAGRVHTDYFSDTDIASSVIVLPGGGLAAGGIFSEGGGDPAFGLAVYKSDGTLDGGFGNGGKVKTRFPAIRSASGVGLALTADGRILQAGSATDPTNPSARFALARFLSDGALDSSFGGDGLVSTEIVLSGQGDVTDALVQPDGKIVVAGKAISNHIVLARFAADGSLDYSFGDDGQVLTHFDSSTELARAIISDNEGRIIVAGGAGFGGISSLNILVMRFSADGALDTAFGQGGKAISPSPFIGSAEAVALDKSGRIVVAGTSVVPGDLGFGLARFRADGAIDTTFATSGTVTIDFGDTDFSDMLEKVSAVAIAADGKILVAGGFEDSFAVARFNDDGRLDISFGDEGKLLIGLGGSTASANDIALLPDGKILLAGWSMNPTTASVSALVRLDANGNLDTGFGVAGTMINNDIYMANDLALQDDGKIVLGGSGAVAGQAGFLVARYNADGSPDTTFGAGGRTLTLLGGRAVTVLKVLIAPEGRIVAAGSAIAGSFTYNVPPPHFYLAAYRADNAAPTSTPTSTPAPPIPTSGPGCRFSDVCVSDYFSAPVDYLLQRGAVSGYADNTFRPFADTTRSQLAKIVVIATSLPIITPAAPTFNDVDERSPFYSYVETAAAWGLIAGYGDGTFRPGFPVTRGQLSKIIVVAEGWPLITPLAPSFSDVASDNPFYGYIETALAHGIISGYDDGTFRWNLGATRGQIAKIVYLAETGAARK